jgi:hypothetical protein
MTSAESLTNSPTSIFWLTVALVALAVFAGIVGYRTWRSSIVQKKLLLSIASRSRLLAVTQAMRGGLEINLKGNSIQDDTYVTAIEVSNVGKSSIKSDDFDGQRPLVLELDVPILAMLPAERTPESAPPPKITSGDSSTFGIEPELFTKGEIIKLAVLTEGRAGRVSVKFNPLGDVAVEIQDREEWLAQRTRKRLVVTAVLSVVLLAMVIVSVVLEVLVTVQADMHLANGNQFSVGAACSTVMAQAGNISETIESVYTEGVIAQVESGKVALPGYIQLLNNISKQVGDLRGEYRAAANSGISLGPAASIPSRASKAIQILNELPKEKSQVKVLTSVDQLRAIADALSGAQAIPSGCRVSLPLAPRM